MACAITKEPDGKGLDQVQGMRLVGRGRGGYGLFIGLLYPWWRSSVRRLLFP